MNRLIEKYSLPLRVITGLGLIVLASLIVYDLMMKPPGEQIGSMALFLSVTALISTAAGYAAHRLGWMERFPTIRWTMLAGYVLSNVLTFLSVWLTARMMLADSQDLLFATVLLFFAGGIAIALGYFFSIALSRRIESLKKAAKAIHDGDFGTRVPIEGRDEIAQLAGSFNEMAGRLEEVDRKQKELESLRRELIAAVSHDLQTPLASVRAILEALADGMVEDQLTQQRYLNTAHKDIQSLSRLIDDLFQMAQLDAGGLPFDREHGSMSDLVSDTLESFSELSSRQGVSVRGRVEPDVDLVWMDTQRIGRVLNNLISNSLSHTHPGCTVWISCTRAGSEVRVVVEDNGEGISPDDLPYIFERFYRGEKSRSRKTGGAGMGLAIARGIITAHGGSISAESEPGKGTKVVFTITS